MTGTIERLAWQKNQKVERTSPGSKNPYKVTYHDGQEKWTDDLPGDGKGGPREKRKQEHKQNRPSIQDGKDKLTAAKKRFVDGKADEGNVRNTVDDVIVHLGREVAREAIRKWLKEQSEGSDGKAKEAEKIIRERMIEKLRKKEAMDNRVEKMAALVVASEVTDTLIGQIRHFLPQIKQAVGKAMGGVVATVVIRKMGSDSVEFTFKGGKVIGPDFEYAGGARVSYDAGADTYNFTPFIMWDRGQFWGHVVQDFYVEDFGDVSKMEYIFKREKDKLPPARPVYQEPSDDEDERTARIASRIVKGEYPGQEKVFGRLDRVNAILEAIKRLPGVADAVINDRTQTADSVEFYVSLKVRERFSKGYPFESRVKQFDVDLNQVRRAIMAALRVDRDLGIQGWQMPKKVFKTSQFMYRRDTQFVGYDRDDIAVDIWVR